MFLNISAFGEIRGQPAERSGTAQALRLAEAFLGEDHPKLAEFLKRLAACRVASGRPAAAIRPARRIVELREKECGAQHPR